jgi:class 3 adenylate cyclase
MPEFAEVPLLVVFTSFNRYAAQTDRLEDVEVAQVMGEYYDLAASAVAAAGGRVVKFIGDATLAVFPAEGVDRGVESVLDLKEISDRFMAERGWDCHLRATVHFGSVAAGHFGGGADPRYDVLGKAVNIAARLETSGVALSVEAFRQLGPDLRKRFKKHTPPVTYIRQEDSHRPRWAKRS